MLVGSFNIDERSTTQNMESLMIAKDCPALAADVTAPLKDLRKVFARDVRAGVAKNEVTNPLWKLFSFMGHSFF